MSDGNKIEELTGNFERDGYTVLRPLIAEPVRGFLYEYVCKAAANGGFKTGDDGVAGTPCAYGDSLVEALLEMLLPQIEVESGRKLFPTYSYLRLYKRGDVLKRHQDRPSCEISVTLNLGYEAAEPWLIWLEAHGKARSCALEPGDGVLYKGIELPHWREKFEGERCAQVFLHYVDQNGPHAWWKYDKRVALSTSPGLERILEGLTG